MNAHVRFGSKAVVLSRQIQLGLAAGTLREGTLDPAFRLAKGSQKAGLQPRSCVLNRNTLANAGKFLSSRKLLAKELGHQLR
jgi:hypothetical protein